MKRITLLFVFIWVVTGFAQIRNYSFSQSIDTYNEIPVSSGTLLGGPDSSEQFFVNPLVPAGGDNLTGDGFPIGFNFVYNGTTYDRFAVSNKGWITLGIASQSPAVNFNISNYKKPLSENSTILPNLPTARIAALSNDILAQTGASLLYKVIGSGTNRILVIQWKGYRKAADGDGDSLNFQIQLYETTNEVKVIYGNIKTNSTPLLAQVGLRAEPANTPTNFSNRASSSGWLNSTSGVLVTDGMILNDSFFPPKGLTYSWIPSTCGAVKELTTTNITTNSASLSWTSYTPIPDRFEYVYSKSSNLPTGSGTVPTGTTTNLSDLDSNTLYKVFFRTKCVDDYTPWFLAGTFKTLCDNQSTFSETFDFYTPIGTSTLPDCWDKILLQSNTYVNVSNPGTTVGTNTNRLTIGAPQGTTKFAYAILPAVNNLSANTHRLRFNAIAPNSGKTLELGYFSNAMDTASWVSLQTYPLPITASGAPQEFTYEPAAISVTNRLFFRIAGLSNSTSTAYVDNVVWEPKPVCANVTDLSTAEITHNSAKINWIAGSTTKWQYLISDINAEVNPYSSVGVDVPGTLPSLTLSTLQPTTNYRVWIRSVCNTSDYGSWIGPISFATTCAPDTVLFENFDASDTLPNCWYKVGTSGSVSIDLNNSPRAPSYKNTLKLSGLGAMVSIRPLINSNTSTHRLKFTVRTSVSLSKLEIGYLTDVNNSATFQKLEEVSVTSVNGFELKSYSLGNSPHSNYLAFRSAGADFYIDDVIWEPNPGNCFDISSIQAVKVASNNAILKWNPGSSETDWQYVTGSLTDINPYLLQAKSFDVLNAVGSSINGNILGLSNDTSYKVWIRANCGGSSNGAFVGPYIIKTSCAPVTDFNQNFDTSTSLPLCWSISGNIGSVHIMKSSSSQVVTTPPNILAGGSKNNPVVIALPAVSNSASSTHRLTFKYGSSDAGALLEVGYLKNIADDNTFVPLGKSFVCAPDFQLGVAELKDEPATEVLAFRIKGDVTGVVYLDDVVWAPVPECKNVSPIKVNKVSHNSIDISWIPGGEETSWQYVIGNTNNSNPDQLTPNAVSGSDPIATITHFEDNTFLFPDTNYKIWVRSKCSEMSLGTWIGPVLVTTLCTPVNTIYEGFNGGVLPTCWRKIGSGGDVKVSNQQGVSFDDKQLVMINDGTIPMVTMPTVEIASFTDHILKFRFIGTTNLEVGYLENISDPSSFVSKELIAPKSAKDLKDVYVINFGDNSFSNTIAFRLPAAGYAYIDKLSWDVSPTVVPDCAQTTALPSTICGNLETVISWPEVVGADGYLFSVGDTAGVYDFIFNKDLGNVLSTKYKGDFAKKYYFKIVPYNYKGEAVNCSVQSYTTLSNGCYCMSVPKNPELLGIVDVKLRDTHFMPKSVKEATYNDFTGKPVNAVRGENTNLNLSFALLNPYKTYVWIDLDDDYNFDDINEKFFTGISLPGTDKPTELDASFVMPANAPFGKHRMRIVAKSGSDEFDSCYNGDFGITLDFVVNIITPVVNDEPSEAVTLIPGTIFGTNAIEGTNVNATGNYGIPDPECANYSGADVWYKAVVPSTGRLTFEINTAAGGLTDTGGVVYSGTPEALQFIQCADAGSDAGDDHPKLTVKNRAPGEILYFRVWDKSGDDYGPFEVSAYDNPALGTDVFDTINFSYYPIPVKDVFNVSFDKEISNITVLNLLGQTVIEKSIDSTHGNVDMSGLSSGTYLVKVTAEKQFKTIKIVKE